MKIIPPSYVAVAEINEVVGASGCGVYVGMIMLLEDAICVCNFASPPQVSYFFQVLLPRLRSKQFKTVCFCSNYQESDAIILMIQCFLDCTSVPFYGYDAMYTENGKIFPGIRARNSNELMEYFCGDYNASFLWLLDCNTGLRVWDPRSKLKISN